MVEDPSPRRRAVDAFVAELVRVRGDAGNPSFRAMARRSGAISHATLHDAVQGTRMPSWETTVEFAKACDIDPASLRKAWERADAIAHPAPDVGASAAAPSGRSGVAGATARHRPADAAPRRHSPVVLVGAALTAGVLLGAGTPALLRHSSTADAGAPSPAGLTVEARTAVPCPSNTDDYPPQPPRVSGDKAMLTADVTIPDCSTQRRGVTLTKTWRLENQGRVEWRDRRLKRIDPLKGDSDCRTVEEVAIPRTPPGRSVDVSIPVTTPRAPVTCFARWMIVDARGAYAFPGQRPFFYSFFVR